MTLALDVATGSSDVINLKTAYDGTLNIGAVVVANVETVNFDATDVFTDVSGATDSYGATIGDGLDDTNSSITITLDIDEAATLNVTGSSDITLDLVGTNNSGADVQTTLVDASALTGKFTLVADGKTAGTTVKGGSGVDTLTASGDNDVLLGNAGNDVLTSAALTTLTGGAGTDTFVVAGIATATLLTGIDGSNYSTITDLVSGEIIDIDLEKNSSGVRLEASTFYSTAVSLSANATFAQYLDQAASNTADREASSVQADEVNVAWFQFNNDTFIVIDREEATVSGTTRTDSDASGFGARDTLIALDGLYDLSTATFNGTTGQLIIA